jgi:hypothetical protein
MTSQEWLRVIGDGLIVWATIVGVASVVVHARVDWWSTPMGRHLMAYMGAYAAVLTLACVRMVLSPSWWFDLIRLVTFVGVPIVMTWRLWLQIQAQRDAVDPCDNDSGSRQ